MASKKRKLQSGDLAFAQRANFREDDLRKVQIGKISVQRKKSISKLDDEIDDLRRELKEIQRDVPQSGLMNAQLMSRPHTTIGARRRMSSSSTTTSQQHCPRHDIQLQSRPKTGQPPMRARTAPPTRRQQSYPVPDGAITAICVNQREPVTESAELLLSSQSHIQGRVVRQQSYVRQMSREHIRQKKMSEISLNDKMSLPYDIATREMDKIVYVNKWLSIKNVHSTRTLPPEAKKYTADWKFDMTAFLEKHFPNDLNVPAEKVAISKEEMEKEKNNFQSLTATTALMKFKTRLAKYRAKSQEERESERLWEELKKIRYLRVRGPVDPGPTLSSVFK